MLSRVRLFATPWNIALGAPLSMGFPRQESWNGLLFLSPGDLPDPGVEPTSSVSPALSGRFFTPLLSLLRGYKSIKVLCTLGNMPEGKFNEKKKYRYRYKNRSLHICLIDFWQKSKVIQWKKNSVVFFRWRWNNWASICKTINLTLYIRFYKKITENGS